MTLKGVENAADLLPTYEKVLAWSLTVPVLKSKMRRFTLRLRFNMMASTTRPEAGTRGKRWAAGGRISSSSDVSYRRTSNTSFTAIPRIRIVPAYRVMFSPLVGGLKA